MVPFASPLDDAERRRHRLRNVLHTWLLILGSGALVALIAWILFGTVGLVWAAVLTGFGLWSAGQVSPRMVLGLYRARPLHARELPELHAIVRQLAVRAELPAVPELFYVPSRMMNAFAVGRPEDSAIAVTDGLLRGLNLRQVTGVLAHEMSHIRNGDLKVMALGDVLTRLTSLMSMTGLLVLAVMLPAMLAEGISVPWLAIVLLIFAPTWGWIALGNVLLGVNQGIAWSMSMISKIELAGPGERGLAAGIDEAFGYGGVAIGAWLTGVIAAHYSLRPEPFYFLMGVVVLALLVAVFWIEETLPYAKAEAANGEASSGRDDGDLPFWEIVKRATYEDSTLFAAAQAGHVENFVDTLVWIGVPLFLAAQGLGPAQIGVVVGVHSGAYFLQVYTGRLGDQIGRKPPIVVGLFLAGAGILGMVLVDGYYLWILFSGLSGVGMALHYPNLISVASDAAHPLWRSTGLGVYRMWRDLGYAVGAVLIGLTVDLLSIEAAFYGVAGAMLVSGAYVLLRMEETHPEFGTHASMTSPQPSGSVPD